MTEEHNEVAEMINKWDGGDTIWTIEMGGLGPGYEQAIQILMVENLPRSSQRQSQGERIKR